MRMKSDIEIITGFIGSGKTSFMNALIENTLYKDEKVLIVLLENGEKDLENKFEKNNRIKTITFDCENPINDHIFEKLLKSHCPHRVIIEFNGTEDINSLLEIIHSKKNKLLCKLTTVFYVAEASTFELYLYNMGNMLLPCFQISNLLVLNNVDNLDKEEMYKLRRNINKIKPNMNVLEIKSVEEITEKVKKSKLFHSGFMKKLDIHLKNTMGKLRD
jgi:G3E family GTPase